MVSYYTEKPRSKSRRKVRGTLRETNKSVVTYTPALPHSARSASISLLAKFASLQMLTP